MRALITGVTGQLGFDIVRVLREQGEECIGVGLEDFDITDLAQTATFIKSYSPSIVVHCSAYTLVDKAETEIQLCQKINIEGTENIAMVCQELDIPMMYFSTDYVFSGQGEQPYNIDDQVGPINIYGDSKYKGELVVKNLLKKFFIIRTSWVFGRNGNNFIKTILRLSETRDTINIVSDQIGSPTYTYDLAKLVSEMMRTDRYGIYHATNEGFCSWAEFAEKVFSIAGKQITIKYIFTEDYPTSAARPKNSRLSKESLVKNGFDLLPSWENAVERFLEEIH